jgi:hypothetical protein
VPISIRIFWRAHLVFFLPKGLFPLFAVLNQRFAIAILNCHSPMHPSAFHFASATPAAHSALSTISCSWRRARPNWSAIRMIAFCWASSGWEKACSSIAISTTTSSIYCFMPRPTSPSPTTTKPSSIFQRFEYSAGSPKLKSSV